MKTKRISIMRDYLCQLNAIAAKRGVRELASELDIGYTSLWRFINKIDVRQYKILEAICQMEEKGLLDLPDKVSISE